VSQPTETVPAPIVKQISYPNTWDNKTGEGVSFGKVKAVDPYGVIEETIMFGAKKENVPANENIEVKRIVLEITKNSNTSFTGAVLHFGSLYQPIKYLAPLVNDDIQTVVLDASDSPALSPWFSVLFEHGSTLFPSGSEIHVTIKSIELKNTDVQVNLPNQITLKKI
jgi:hypothetical protein